MQNAILLKIFTLFFTATVCVAGTEIDFSVARENIQTEIAKTKDCFDKTSEQEIDNFFTNIRRDTGFKDIAWDGENSHQKQILSTDSGKFTETTLTDHSLVGLSKREYTSFIVNRKETDRFIWNSEILQEGCCSSGFMVAPNFIQWKLRGHECGFVLFKLQGCKGPIALDTNGFNVLTDGSMETLEFKSVYFACR